MTEHVAPLRALMTAIQQDDEGRWFVAGGDPELTCCEAANALDALEDERRRWQTIDSAPRDGSHFLACKAGTTFGWWDGKPAPPFQTVVHWWGNPGEEGFYTSVNETEPQHPFEATHWKPLDAPDAGGLGRTVAAMVRETDAAVDAILRGDAS